jgi:hypothetical protein
MMGYRFMHVSAEDLLVQKVFALLTLAPTSSTGGVLEGGVRVDKTPVHSIIMTSFSRENCQK